MVNDGGKDRDLRPCFRTDSWANLGYVEVVFSPEMLSQVR